MSNEICTPESAEASSKPKARTINKEGMQLIKESESCVLKAYPDPASLLAQKLKRSKTKDVAQLMATFSGEPWTVGWGSTGLDYFNLDEKGQPTKIGPGTVWTQEQADQRKAQDIEWFCAAVESMVTVPLTDNQFAALVSFAYNCGVTNLRSSTLLRKLNEGKTEEAAAEFPKWNKAQGKVLPGLTIRRNKERTLFLKP